ncbi:SafA/ExsA family spore coat assembly protein [Guptibacillus algicola]|uniref:SafA/ExsA family spore coat assembly protein n=1 Tax=Guptibacillus algicola TaxID=225844 RepID=UPI001CD373B5|nr:SafA/ExsA family spore coat assembly protein [Alkalihalobacillus algicola]MCA0987942.1 SafA/ExsA family spore coat assembly protein [Alkalihalobacillus algicola]
MKRYVSVAVFLVLFLAAGIFTPDTAFGQTTYTVKSGDTLWKISVRYKIGLSEIINANPHFENPDLIYPGDRVNIPTGNPSINESKDVGQQVMDLTNQERSKYGLAPLKWDWEVARVARYKSADMRDKNYFSHTSPTYGSPFQMLKNFGVSYRSAGENIAAGQSTPQEVVNAWMNSEGHRKNILNKGYTHIGVGYVSGGSYGHYWTQMFISK